MGGGRGRYPASALGATPTRGIKHFLPVMEWRGIDCYTISVTGTAWYLLWTTPSTCNSSSSPSPPPRLLRRLHLPSTFDALLQLISLDLFLNFSFIFLQPSTPSAHLPGLLPQRLQRRLFICLVSLRKSGSEGLQLYRFRVRRWEELQLFLLALI